MSKSLKPDAIQAIAIRRVDRLRGLSFAEIAALPTRQDEIERVGDREVATATYCDPLPNGRIRLVVQAYHHRFLGMGTMTADGFIIAPDGTRTAVPEEMMWEFV